MIIKYYLAIGPYNLHEIEMRDSSKNNSRDMPNHIPNFNFITYWFVQLWIIDIFCPLIICDPPFFVTVHNCTSQ